MAKRIYIGVNNVAREIKKGYIGVNNVARKIKKGYIGVGGVARLFYSVEDKLKASGYVSTGTDRTDGPIKPYVGKYASTAANGKVINSSLTITTLSSTTAYNTYMRGNTNTYMYGYHNTGNYNNVTSYKAIFRFVDANLTETVSGSLSSHRWLDTSCASASKQSTYSIITLTNYYQAVYAITNSKTLQQLSTTVASINANVGCIDAYQLKIGGTPSNNNGYDIGSKTVDVYNSSMTRSMLTLPFNYPYDKTSASRRRQNAVASTDLGVLVRSAVNADSTCFINKSLTLTNVPEYTTGNDPDANSIGFKTLCVTTPGKSTGVSSVYVTHVDTMTTETVATSNKLYERCYLSHNDDTVFVGGGMVSDDDRDKYYEYICGLKLA